jgi:hypothetical protein
MYVEGNVVVAEFTRAAAFDEVEQIQEAFVRCVRQPRVTAHVAHMDLDRSPGERMLGGAAEAAAVGSEHGLEKWAAVADSIERLAVKCRVSEADIDVLATDDVTEAMTWARE